MAFVEFGIDIVCIDWEKLGHRTSFRLQRVASCHGTYVTYQNAFIEFFLQSSSHWSFNPIHLVYTSQPASFAVPLMVVRAAQQPAAEMLAARPQ